MDAPINEQEKITQYLLGSLRAEEQLQVQQRIFEQEGYDQLVLEVENDLIDAYVREELSPPQREQFESRFFSRAESAQRLEFSKALAGVIADPQWKGSKADSSRGSSGAALAAFLDAILKPVPVAAFALAAVLVSSWMLLRVDRMSERLLRLEQERAVLAQQVLDLSRRLETRAEVAPPPVDSPLTPAATGNAANATPAMPRTVAGTQDEDAPPSSVLVLMLSPQVLRSSGSVATTRIPSRVRTLRLQLEVPEDEPYTRFNAQLKNEGGENIKQSQELSADSVAGGKVVYLELASIQLPAGRYEVQLSGIRAGATLEPVAFYYFEVLKE